MNIDILWDNFLEKIKPKISSLSYDTWFKNTKLVSFLFSPIFIRRERFGGIGTIAI